MGAQGMSGVLASGWTDDRLMQAFDLIDAVLGETHPEHDAHALLKKARGLVEDADIELERTAA